MIIGTVLLGTYFDEASLLGFENLCCYCLLTFA